MKSSNKHMVSKQSQSLNVSLAQQLEIPKEILPSPLLPNYLVESLQS